MVAGAERDLAGRERDLAISMAWFLGFARGRRKRESCITGSLRAPPSRAAAHGAHRSCRGRTSCPGRGWPRDLRAAVPSPKAGRLQELRASSGTEYELLAGAGRRRLASSATGPELHRSAALPATCCRRRPLRGACAASPTGGERC
ncbi:unnamed protein product [Urochloa humidicola]